MIIRDPVHGDIELTPAERTLLDNPMVQRLRRIKQLGTAYLVYPGCMHTRFEHSLGTLWTTTLILDALRRRGYSVSDEVQRTLRAAALVHDVAHIPFGHTFEDERKVFERHDTPQRLRRFLVESDLGEALAKQGLLEDVYRLLTRPDDWQGQVVSGVFDADLLDYLRRDAYFAGLSQSYDERIYSYFCIEEGQLAVDLTKGGLERHDARSEIIHLLRLRYFLTERVYFHHAKVISGAMISKALELALELGVRAEDLYDKGDETLLAFFEDVGREHEPDERARGIAHLVRGVKERRLYKRAYLRTYDGTPPSVRQQLIERYHASVTRRSALEQAIADAAGVSAHHVIVYCPARSALKEAGVLARLPTTTCRLDQMPGRHMELDALAEQYTRIWRFWVFAHPTAQAAVAKAAEDVLDLPNELTGSV